jgi:type IV secretion system protein VirD4
MSKVHFVLDEAATMGHLDCVDDALGLGRGYGIRLQLYYQSVGQAKKSFPEGQNQTLLSNTSQVFFAVNDQGTAELVSNRLGEETIVVDSGGDSSGDSSTTCHGHGGSVSRGWSRNRNRNWQQQARKLLKSEEVMALSPREAITFTPGVRPIFTRLLRYYEHNFRPGWIARQRQDFVIFFKAAATCAFALIVALAVTIAISGKASPASADRPAQPRSEDVQSIRNGAATVQRDQGRSPGNRTGAKEPRARSVGGG